MQGSSGGIKRAIRFDAFEVDVCSGQLKKRNRRVKVQDLPFRLLVTLLERPGEIVTREQLRTQLWGDTVVDYDDCLHAAVRKLRDVLGDSATHPRFIETVPRRGYCFIATVSTPVEEVHEKRAEAEPAAPQAAIPAVPHDARPKGILPRIAGKYVWIASVGILLLASLTVLLKNSARSELRPSDVIPITSYRGVQGSPALSPDGTQLAFTWVGESGDNLDIYVQHIDGTGRVRLTSDPAPEQYVAWSPDGKTIAFTRMGNLISMPAGGGQERRIATASGAGISWSPDARWIAVSDAVIPDGPCGIYLVSVDSGEKRRLTLPASSREDDAWPAFSADGQSVAFVRRATTATGIYRVSRSGGDPVRVAIAGKPVRGLVWSPDGEYLLFATGRHSPGLLSVPAKARDSTRLERIDIAGFSVSEPSIIARKGSRKVDLAYVHETTDWDIWGAAIGNEHASPAPLAASIRADQSPSFSPDGRRLAFCSARTGFEEIWVAMADGSHPQQLTHFNSGVANSPRWSPDGRWIAFDATIDNNPDVYVVSSDGGLPRRMTRESSGEVQPSWSGDGQWLYFMSDRSGSKQIWKMPSGGGQAVQVTQQGGFQARESGDGRYLYYAKSATDYRKWRSGRGIWRVPVTGGPEILVTELAWANLWSLAGDGLYYLDVADRVPEVFDIARPIPVRRLDLVTNNTTTVATIEASFPDGVGALEIRADSKYMAWVSWHEHNAEIMFIRNLRLAPR
jgi:Tol biopolymer transport system component/DNA-binding winged helix-turn-helix (wHTH) protein